MVCLETKAAPFFTPEGDFRDWLLRTWTGAIPLAEEDVSLGGGTERYVSGGAIANEAESMKGDGVMVILIVEVDVVEVAVTEENCCWTEEKLGAGGGHGRLGGGYGEEGRLCMS